VRRPVRLGLLVSAGVVLGWVAGGAVLFVWAPQDSPSHADAVVVLAGGKGPRLAEGLRLMRRGVAHVLVISDGWDPAWPEANRLCAGRPEPFRVICFRPTPYDTRGEARGFTRLASARGWSSVIVVSSRYHVVRAKILFERCYHGRVQAVGTPFSAWHAPSAVISETVKLAYALLLARSC
jgi:uncharacterized SAM-binding protein YcdF (DUF218 family)